MFPIPFARRADTATVLMLRQTENSMTESIERRLGKLNSFSIGNPVLSL